MGFWKKLKKVDPHYFFRGGLLSSLVFQNHSKCLKTAILPLKPTKVDFLRNFNFEALKVVFGKKVKKVDPLKIQSEPNSCRLT